MPEIFPFIVRPNRMKKTIVNILKVGLPLGFGIFLIWLFYDALCPDQRTELFGAFGKANYFWVGFSVILGFISHLSRSWRWRYMLESMGYKIKFWNGYHAVMIGYIVNLIFPRAGEASRAGILSKTENVPFEKGFGSIIAERAIDVVMLGIITGIALLLQWNMLDEFQTKISGFTSGESGCGNAFIFGLLGKIVLYLIVAAVTGGVIMAIASKKFRKKFIDFIKGIWEGGMSIFRMKKKLLFIGHTFIIWILYVAMFIVCFFAIDSTATLGINAWLAGFIAGTVGLVMVQGGIGVYPAFVGLIVTTYLNPQAPGILPDALALGWIMWSSQTIMMIILGLVSLILNGKQVKLINEQPQSN